MAENSFWKNIENNPNKIVGTFKKQKLK